MRIATSLAAVLALAATGAAAQVPVKPDVPMILAWTPEQQARWYPAMEDVFRVTTIERGRRVYPLPYAARRIDDVSFEHEGKRFTTAEYMAAYNVSGVLVIKDGRILLERYGMGRKPTDRWTSFSVAKSVTSTLVGAAIQEGRIKSLHEPVTTYLPELKGSAYDGVTVRQLLMMSSGVKWNEDYADPNSDVARAGAPTGEPGNPILNYMRKLPRAEPPGTKFNYNTGETDLVGMLLQRATGKSLSDYASETIWKPYGMEADAIWMVDGGGLERGGCCMSMTLRDYGRLGQFILDGGKAKGRQVLPPDFLAQAITPQITNGAPEPGYGYFWWMRPQGGFEARGIYGQGIVIVPEERLVVVVNSAWPQAVGREMGAPRTAFYEAIRAAAKAF